ncbi:MAG: response regulator [Chloroflexales bacterium]|nr:response regulator [Chloroflexales bacterium]
MGSQTSPTIQPRGSPPHPILVVDDELAIVVMLQDVLEDAGYPVLTASNGRAALAIANQTTLALVFSDMMMPQMDGDTLCQALRADARTAELPIILMTAARRAPPACAATAVLAKPFDIDVVLELAQRHYR